MSVKMRNETLFCHLAVTQGSTANQEMGSELITTQILTCCARYGHSELEFETQVTKPPDNILNQESISLAWTF